MAKKDELSVAERLLALRKEADELQGLVAQELEDELNAILAKYDDLGVDLPRSLINRVMDMAPVVNRQAPLRTRNAAPGEKVQRACKICGKTGHNARTCDQNPKNFGPPTVVVGDPKLVKKDEATA